MSPPVSDRWTALTLAASLAVLAGSSRTIAVQPAVSAATEASLAVESYLESHALKALLAEQLGQRFRQSSTEERLALAERLGSLYVELLSAATDDASRQMWEQRARELIAAAPEAKSYELRITLARTLYAEAEDLAERHRLRLLDPPQVAALEQSLRKLSQEFETLATDTARRFDSLDRSAAAGREPEKFQQEITDLRRLRSIASYYAGWASYYHATVTGSSATADRALENFAMLLGRATSDKPRAEKLNLDLLKFDHIARASIGAALCYSLKDQHVEALRWLDLVEKSPDTPADVRESIFPRRVSVLARAGRWDDVSRLVDAARVNIVPTHASTPSAAARKPLPTLWARLIGVLTLEVPTPAPDVVRDLAQQSLQDLIARGEAAHVLDMVKRFGTASLGDSGFIALYVRGSRDFDAAMDRLTASGADTDKPAADPAIINAFRDSATLLESSQQQPDAANFPGSRVRALLLAGRARFHATDLRPAAELFARAAELAHASGDQTTSQDATWRAVVALDLALSLNTASAEAAIIEQRLEEVSTLMIRRFPTSQRAAALLLKRSERSGVGDQEAIRILLGVPKGDSLYDGARRQAARLLYRAYRAASPADRAIASARFVSIAEEVLAVEHALTRADSETESSAASDRVVILARQTLDALLSVPSPDIRRAEDVLSLVQSVIAYRRMDTSAFRDELDFRRLQLHLARGETDAAAAIADALTKPLDPGSTADPATRQRLAVSAQRLLYIRAAERWRAARRSGTTGQSSTQPAASAPGAEVIEHARAVIAHGRIVADQFGSSTDPASVNVFATIAAAATDIFRASGDPAMRDLALAMDARVLKAVPAERDALLRTAELAEGAGNAKLSLDCWRKLLVGLPQGSPEWFRARFESIRILAITDAEAARVAIAQHRVLYPDLGPEPWGSRIRDLATMLGEPERPVRAPKGGKGGTSPRVLMDDAPAHRTERTVL